ncbi:hypothetical protein GOODEAATRI_017691 [Goodea atripinnis]|uniref:Uncharacterized protein n=1 Tax=Goodea atripinnis TaxID=208336 RepID=A0ABV0NDQ9_9TELE
MSRLALLTEFRTCRSCHVGTRCLVGQSAAKTWLMGFSCSNTRWIIFCLDPHLVGDSVMSCSLSFLSLQQCPLPHPAVTMFLQAATALSILGSFILLSAL